MRLAQLSLADSDLAHTSSPLVLSLTWGTLNKLDSDPLLPRNSTRISGLGHRISMFFPDDSNRQPGLREPFSGRNHSCAPASTCIPKALLKRLSRWQGGGGGAVSTSRVLTQQPCFHVFIITEHFQQQSQTGRYFPHPHSYFSRV